MIRIPAHKAPLANTRPAGQRHSDPRPALVAYRVSKDRSVLVSMSTGMYIASDWLSRAAA